ncbi:MAG: hypothetical protein DI554_11485 [Sphingobium sp.]|nr:MAG: hypothetical protein DI554_11485 [Sphingobium sp.]
MTANDQKRTFLPGTGRWQREALTEGQEPLGAELSGLCPSTTRYASGPPPRAGEECLVPTQIRHSRAGGNPSPDLASGPKLVRWIPACAGLTL